MTRSEPRLDAHQIAAECESKNASEPLRMEQKGWIEEVRWSTRRWPKRYEAESGGKKRSDRGTVAVPETESAAPEPSENPIEPEANPKRRLLMKSASLTGSGSGQQRQKRSIPDDESGMQVEDTLETGTGEGTALPAAPSANIRRRIVVKSEPVAFTTQDPVDGHCEKAMRIASVEQIEQSNIMELSITGSGAQVGKAIPLGRSVATQTGWMEPEKSQPPDSHQALA